MYALKSADPIFRTYKVVYSQMKSNLQGLLPDESAIQGSIACLNMQAIADSSSSSGITLISATWRKYQSGCYFCQPRHSFLQFCLIMTLKSPNYKHRPTQVPICFIYYHNGLQPFLSIIHPLL